MLTALCILYKNRLDLPGFFHGQRTDTVPDVPLHARVPGDLNPHHPGPGNIQKMGIPSINSSSVYNDFRKTGTAPDDSR
jgi:hypothetical protein